MQIFDLENRPAFLPADVIFESFTFPLFDMNFAADHVGLARAFLSKIDAQPEKGQRGIYVHIPFCDTICGFCPFEKGFAEEEKIGNYMRALEREIDLLSSTALIGSWKPNSIYFGGGTPSVLGPERSARLIAKVRGVFNFTPDVEISFEVEPKSATPELFDAISEAGVTRVSFGVQTLQPDSRRLMNLTATPEDIARTVELSLRHFDNTNMDMIVGFPGQTVDDALIDMTAAARFGLGSISLYPMDYVAVLPAILNNIRSGKIPPPPSGNARWEMFHAARGQLMRHYDEQNMYCFGKPSSPRCRYMFGTLYGGYHDQCLGLGLGAYTTVRGLMYVNRRLMPQYLSAIAAGEMPIERASPGHAYEKSYVYMPKRLNGDLAEARELRIDATIEAKIEALAACGLLSVDGAKFSLTELGKSHYAQMMVGFLSEPQRRLYDGAAQRLTQELKWDVTGATGKDKANLKSYGGRNALPVEAA